MTNRLFPAAGTALLALLLGGCASAPDIAWMGNDRLAPCTAKGTPFENMAIKKWPETYHATVSKVIEAHMKQAGDASSAQITCTGDDYSSMMKPTDELQSLASTLPPWKGKKVSELELAPVLLEYLRTYECSLQEKKYFLYLSPLEQESGASSEPAKDLPLGDYVTQVTEESEIIERELASARPILERTLTLAGGLDRFRPLAMDVECINRASLDLRNVLGLTAEASACMPRIWDARGSLRDPPQRSSSSSSAEKR